MKNVGRILCLVILTMVMTVGLSFADAPNAGLKLIDQSPESGSHSSPPTNLGIKLFFNGNVADKSVQEANSECFTLKNEKGKEIKVKALYTEKDPTYILVLTQPKDTTEGLGSDKEYTLTIDANLKSVDGKVLGKEETITFKTRNSEFDMTINMVIMVIMMVAMLVLTSLSMKRQMKKEMEAREANKVNPYKIARETGKPVEEVIEDLEKKKAKAAKKAAKEKGLIDDDDNDDDEIVDDGRKRVKGPRPISVTGSTYKSGKKAEAERKAAEEAKKRAQGTTKPKNTKGKAKNKKK